MMPDKQSIAAEHSVNHALLLLESICMHARRTGSIVVGKGKPLQLDLFHLKIAKLINYPLA